MESPVSAFSVYTQNPSKHIKHTEENLKLTRKKKRKLNIHMQKAKLRNSERKAHRKNRRFDEKTKKSELIKQDVLSEIKNQNKNININKNTPPLIKLINIKTKTTNSSDPAIKEESSKGKESKKVTKVTDKAKVAKVTKTAKVAKVTKKTEEAKITKRFEVTKKAEISKVSKKAEVKKKPKLSEKSKVSLKQSNASVLEQQEDLQSECTSSDEQHGSIYSDESFDFEPVHTDSRVEGKKVFEWLISPCEVENFFTEIWEKTPIHIKRNHKTYYMNLISTPKIDNMLRMENLQFTKNIDITSYNGKRRETHNPVGRAHPHVVWDYYLNGCSVRLLNPQTYLQRLHLLNATMQEYFNSFVGANAYLTPPDSQGFAPHYDDIEAFVLQVEGKKRWKVYKPLSEDDTLPRVSSKNFEQDEIGEPIMEVTLEAGDLLYFPRGYIHQGITIDGEHSLHLTISFYQNHSWADLFEKMLPASLNTAISQSLELRRGLPLHIYDHLGLIHSELETPDAPRRIEIISKIKELLNIVGDNLAFDFAADEMAKKFQHDALPPVLTASEIDCSVFGESDCMVKKGNVINRVEIEPDTKIRLLRRNILRMVMDDESIRLYFNIENSLEYHGNEPQYMEVDAETAPAIETLLRAYPDYIKVDSLGLEDITDSVSTASTLWEKGLIITEFPMPTIE